jgi:dTDP-glucose 4,6-dehydratase
MSEPRFSEDDISTVLRGAGGAWEEMRGKRLFMTGATGFFGRWLLESLWAADRQQGLGVQVAALSREPERFLRVSPHLGSWRGLSWVRGSVATLTPEMMPGARFDWVVHLATEGDLRVTAADPAAATAVIAGGTRRALEFGAASGARRFLLTSSGSVYAPQAPEVGLLTEDQALGSTGGTRPDAHAIGAEAKRLAERLCLEAPREWGLCAVIARCFTFAGPGQPLEGRFAFGNFMHDAVAGRRISLSGDGTPVRSYLYAADLAAWLWTMLAFGAAGRCYNVGSEDPISIRGLSEAIARELGAPGIDATNAPVPGQPHRRYVPSTARARTELGLRQTVSLPEAIRRTAGWLRN